MCRERASVTRRSATAGQSYPATKLVFILIYIRTVSRTDIGRAARTRLYSFIFFMQNMGAAPPSLLPLPEPIKQR
jgi:hypothetical protein